MKYWAIGLHFYQPPTQEVEITRNILDFCYLPLLRMLSEKSGFGLTVNISGSLLVQLKQMGITEFFDLVKKLVRDRKIEIVNSVMYHPLIPITSHDVVERQIERNSSILKDLLGVETTTGFFPPELAVDQTSLNLIKSRYVFVDQTAVDITSPIGKYNDRYLLINNRPICELLRGFPERLRSEMVLGIVNESCQDEGLVVSMNDAELFGHHYSERLEVLAGLIETKEVELIMASEAVDRFGQTATEITSIKASTWQECEGFDLWNSNPLQKKYLNLIDTAHDAIDETDFFDQANSSCYLYWLSNWPWWHPGLVEKGAAGLKKSPGHQEFLDAMWEYHNSGQVEKGYEEFRRTRDSMKKYQAKG